jgi:glycosyltransferase involved in cell wall biosynthesis
MNPEISVIIVSYNARNLISDCLSSLEKQITSKIFEIILVDSSSDGTSEFVEEAFPNVEVHHFSERKFPGDARNIGISVAKGEFIAFIDADCRAEDNWLEEIGKAQESTRPVVGGAIANANPKSYVSWAAYFCEFSHWMPNALPRWLDDMPTANLSYKKTLFSQYGSFIEGSYCSDTEFNWRLGRDGHCLRFEPSILVSHYSIENLRQFLAHEFHHGRSFGRVRIKAQKFSPWKRAFYVAGAPLLSLKIFGKVTFNNIKNRVYFPQFIAALPLLILGIICWSMGEVVAYAGG